MVGRTADSLVAALLLDEQPSLAAAIDYGLDDPNPTKYSLKLTYLQRLVREGILDADKLHSVAGNGPALTKLVQGCFEPGQCNVVYSTVYDSMVDY